MRFHISLAITARPVFNFSCSGEISDITATSGSSGTSEWTVIVGPEICATPQCSLEKPDQLSDKRPDDAFTV